jgi:hypothetical protein
MKLFRAMREHPDALPLAGPGGRMLGVRPGHTPTPDVLAVHAGDPVLPGQGGMSVAPDDPMNLIKHRRPRSLGGTGQDPVWLIGIDELGPDLRFRQDSPTHGVIEPARPMTLREFQGALASTRPRWGLYCR